MYCEDCDCEWSATHGGERCDFCGEFGQSGYYPETAKDRAAFVNSAARWRDVHRKSSETSALPATPAAAL